MKKLYILFFIIFLLPSQSYALLIVEHNGSNNPVTESPAWQSHIGPNTSGYAVDDNGLVTF